MTKRPSTVLYLSLVLLAGVVAPAAAEDADIPLEFRFVGSYSLEKRVKMREGRPFPVAIGESIYRAYTDGVSVRLYGGEKNEGYTEFSIYRNDGVVVRKSQTLMETVAGVQARSLVGNVMRQLTLTQSKLTLTKFPALSDLVQITYAVRVPEETVATIEKPTSENP